MIFFVHESKWFGSWVQQQLAAHWRGRLSVNKSINFVYFSCNYILWLQNMVRKSHRLLFGCFYSAFLKLESFIHSNCMEKNTEFILLCSVEENKSYRFATATTWGWVNDGRLLIQSIPLRWISEYNTNPNTDSKYNSIIQYGREGGYAILWQDSAS